MRIDRIIIAILVIGSFGCEESITVDTADVASSIVIDAFVDNRPDVQTISITRSRPFYENTPFETVSADEVFIEDLTDPSQADYVFAESSSSPGIFEWFPTASIDSFGIVGHDYRLTVRVGNAEFTAVSTLNPVPVIDSIRFNYEEEDSFFDERFEAEFFATDLPGFGDTYWIKAFKNNVFLDRPEYIATSYDGGFSASDEDGILFIPPLRTFINPFEDNEQGYDVNDTVRVELMSVTEETFLYLNEIFTQTDRQGGISELFSVPVTNLNTTFEVVAGDESVLGIFSTSSVHISQLVLTEELAQEAFEKAQ